MYDWLFCFEQHDYHKQLHVFKYEPHHIFCLILKPTQDVFMPKPNQTLTMGWWHHKTDLSSNSGVVWSIEVSNLLVVLDSMEKQCILLYFSLPAADKGVTFAAAITFFVYRWQPTHTVHLYRTGTCTSAAVGKKQLCLPSICNQYTHNANSNTSVLTVSAICYKRLH